MLLFIDFCECAWWIPWLLPFLLGLLLGWLIWGRLKGRIEELEGEIVKLKANIGGLEGDLAECHSSKAGLDSKIALLQGRIKEMSSRDDAPSSDGGGALGFVAGAAVSELGDREEASPAIPVMAVPTPPSAAKGSKNAFAALKSDNLQVVEGIGPKMNEVLNKGGVHTWADLGAKTPAELRDILDNANAARYRIIDPKTWPEQARLADSGQWDGLIHLQKNLDTGRAEGAKGETDSKVEKMLIKMGVLKRWKQDDLTAVEGIGPKISGLLHDAGINTWRTLANTEVPKIQGILDAAGKRYKLADPDSWPKQAEMAADGRWDDLQEYQDFLQGGK